MHSIILFRLGFGWLLVLVAAVFLLYAYWRTREWGLLCLGLAAVAFVSGKVLFEFGMEAMHHSLRGTRAAAFGFDLHLSQSKASAFSEVPVRYEVGALLLNLAAPALALVASVRFAFMHRERRGG